MTWPLAIGKRRRSGSPRVLVVGCGGPFAADDNVGLEIVRRLRRVVTADASSWNWRTAPSACSIP